MIRLHSQTVFFFLFLFFLFFSWSGKIGSFVDFSQYSPSFLLLRLLAVNFPLLSAKFTAPYFCSLHYVGMVTWCFYTPLPLPLAAIHPFIHAYSSTACFRTVILANHDEVNPLSTRMLYRFFIDVAFAMMRGTNVFHSFHNGAFLSSSTDVPFLIFRMSLHCSVLHSTVQYTILHPFVFSVSFPSSFLAATCAHCFICYLLVSLIAFISLA